MYPPYIWDKMILAQLIDSYKLNSPTLTLKFLLLKTAGGAESKIRGKEAQVWQKDAQMRGEGHISGADMGAREAGGENLKWDWRVKFKPPSGQGGGMAA